MKEISGKRLQAARVNAGLSLTGLSKKTNGTILPARISNYEQGTRQLPVEVAITFADVLGVTPGYLLGLDDGYSTRLENLSPNQKNLFKLLNKINLQSEQEFQKVVSMLEAYLDSK